MRSVRRGAAAVAVTAGVTVGVLLGGCGGGSSTGTATPVTQLQREDFLAVVHALASAEPAMAKEVAATKSAWQLVANGLPIRPSAGSRVAIETAGEAAAELKLPALFGEREAAALTGPGSGPVGLFRTFVGLSSRGWQLIGSSIEAIEHGSPSAARFAHANVALYIESVYDAHFSVAQIGKQIKAGYEHLGGATAFGWRLTQPEVDRLVATYSEASARLHPHVGVQLGS